ncbi:CBS domain-containing protein [Methylophilaceae bacterium]|mgnify:CR=1 FL=1|jgi:magnesium and cobalt transporter|nr:CBS domain-containing protein [Betaproteobacteria bacterium]MDA9096987.1 CBS domain-containing protein [Methylophilaceae bacterium]MDC0115621.1 CBS domain-containing protein [Methylophilaceae bacterium]MDC0877190.1 transporter associated domain-containing protein [Methylophilaceae bacterium]MDC1281403.1 CBS domain-containing protein [Methylophilaceae bacterium]
MNKKKSKIVRKIRNLLIRPKDKEHLGDILKQAFDKHMLDADSLMMLEGVLNVSEMQVRDIMIPRSQMDFIDISKKPEEFIPFVIETAHSRFPVIEGSMNDVIGILLAKDLLNYHDGQDFELRDKLRLAIFVPESKRLNVLLKDFKKNRNHIAIVVDEYGGVSGMVTIEDVLEQIVGDIEDEYDYDETEDNIIEEKSGKFRIKAATEIEDFNAFFATEYTDEEFTTVGGLITNKFGYLPEKDEKITFDGFDITILRADSRQIHTLMVYVNLPQDKA